MRFEHGVQAICISSSCIISGVLRHRSDRQCKHLQAHSSVSPGLTGVTSHTHHTAALGRMDGLSVQSSCLRLISLFYGRFANYSIATAARRLPCILRISRTNIAFHGYAAYIWHKATSTSCFLHILACKLAITCFCFFSMARIWITTHWHGMGGWDGACRAFRHSAIWWRTSSPQHHQTATPSRRVLHVLSSFLLDRFFCEHNGNRWHRQTRGLSAT